MGTSRLVMGLVGLNVVLVGALLVRDQRVSAAGDHRALKAYTCQ